MPPRPTKLFATWAAPPVLRSISVVPPGPVAPVVPDGSAVPARVLDDLVIGRARREDVTDPLDVVPERTQEGDRAGRDVQVGEQPHATAEVRSLASQAPYLAAW